MRVTVDANAVFACLIRDSIARRIFFSPNTEIYAPAFIINEFLKYVKTIKDKSKNAEFEGLLEKVVSRIRMVPDEELTAYILAVSTLVKDNEDWLYLACALKYGTIIWSDDRELKKQGRIKVKATRELAQEADLL